MGGVPFIRLHERRGVGERMVPAAVVEVEMAVDDVRDLGGVDAVGGELASTRSPAYSSTVKTLASPPSSSVEVINVSWSPVSKMTMPRSCTTA